MQEQRGRCRAHRSLGDGVEDVGPDHFEIGSETGFKSRLEGLASRAKPNVETSDHQ